MPRLTKGAREAITQIDLDLVDAFNALAKARHWNSRREPLDVSRELIDLEKAIQRIKERIHDDIEPMLQRRADNQPTLEDQIRANKEQIQDLIERVKQLESASGPRLVNPTTERTRHG